MNFTFDAQKTAQHESEVRALVDFLLQQGSIETILEVGVYRGGTASVWSQLAQRVVLVDDLFDDAGWYERPNITKVLGKSQDPEVIAKVREVLAGREVDFLFLDGAHDMPSERADLENYSQLVREDGWVAIHDIENPACNDCRLLWEELKAGREHYEFIIQRQPPDKKQTIFGLKKHLGIGLIRWQKRSLTSATG